MPHQEGLSAGLTEFSTDGVRDADKFEFWREQFGSVHTVEVESTLRTFFAARGTTWRLGPVLVAEFATPARRVVRNRRQVRRDDLDHITLRVALDAPFNYQSGDTRLEIRRGEVIIGTYAQTYDDELPAGRWVSAILDRDAFPAFWGWS